MWETVYSVGSTTASTINIRLRARIKGLRKNWPLAIILIIIILTITSLAETLKRCDQVCACYWDRPHLPAQGAPSAPPSPPSLQLHHYLHRYSDQNITDIRNGQGSHSDTTSFGESHHPLAFNLFPRPENKEKCPTKSIFPVRSH